MRVDLAYGKSGLVINVPDKQSTIIEPTFVAGLEDEICALQKSLRNPIEKKSVKTWI